MKDINFFTPYIDKKKVKFNNKFFLSILFMIFSLFIAGYGVINQLQINKLSEKKMEFKKVAEDPKTLRKVDLIKQEEDELNKFEVEIESIKSLKDSVEEREFINSSYIDKIINKRPEDLFLTSLSISFDNISITGISNNRLSIAEFAKGLKTIDRFENIFISNIIKEETDYKFELESNISEEEVEDVPETNESKEESEEVEEEQKEN